MVTLVGTWPRVNASFTSNPPLSNDAILGLDPERLAARTRAAQADLRASSCRPRAASSRGAVTGALTRADAALFKLDRFQIDPVFEGSTLTTFRTTIGKQITQDLLGDLLDLARLEQAAAHPDRVAGDRHDPR